MIDKKCDFGPAQPGVFVSSLLSHSHTSPLFCILISAVLFLLRFISTLYSRVSYLPALIYSPYFEAMSHLHNQGKPTKEEEAVKMIRQKISDVILEDKKFDDDFYLLQWLKAQKLNPEKTEDTIRNAVKWRREQNIHTNIEGEYSQSFIEDFLIPTSKTKDGIPIAYMKVGTMNFKDGVATCGTNRWNKFWAMKFAQLEQQLINYNKCRNKGTTTPLNSHSTQGLVGLIDANDFSSLQLLNLDVLRSSIETVTNLMNVFPAMFDTVIVYNMGSAFNIIFSTILPFLIGPTVSIYGYDEKVWRDKLLEIIESEDLNELENNWK